MPVEFKITLDDGTDVFFQVQRNREGEVEFGFSFDPVYDPIYVVRQLKSAWEEIDSRAHQYLEQYENSCREADEDDHAELYGDSGVA